MSKIKIEIKSWATGGVLFEYESENATIKKALESAIDGGADLRDADLRGADLSGADLSDADLSGADLSGADLSDADLSGADLSGATIYYSDNNIDTEYRKDRFIRNTQIESVETEMKHNTKSCRRWSFIWKNVLRIKSWKLKSTDSSFEAVSRNANAMSEAIADSVKPQGGDDDCAKSDEQNIAVGDTVAFKHGEAPQALRGEVVAIKGDEAVVSRYMIIGSETFILSMNDLYLIGRDEDKEASSES